MEEDLFLKELEKIEEQYKKEQKAHQSFNIVRALHKIDDERRLHSRFIAYLLSPASMHGMDNTYLKKFIALIPQLNDFDLENEIKVFPNEFEKSEKHNIDILIVNETTNQAIIIENKINAKDSNRKKKIKRASQIYDVKSKYSNIDQEDIAQLKAYFKIFKDKSGFKYNNDDDAIKKIHLVYLTLNRKDPSLKDQFGGFNLTLIDYRTEIKQWLEGCINDKATNDFLKEILRQYLDMTIQLTNDVDRAKYLKELISDYNDLAWRNKEEVFKLSDFIHVKWHTVDAFWNELITELEQNLNTKILEGKRITTDEITKQTHKGNKNPYGIVFEINDKQLYVMNDAQEGLTIGYAISSDREKPKNQWDTIDDKIKFYDFNDIATFEKINKDKRKDLINDTIERINEFIGRK